MNKQHVSPRRIWGRVGSTGLFALALMIGMGGIVGCERYKGAGFPSWNQSMGGMRGSSNDTKSSGFFTDRRSEQIEKNLGGF